MKKAAVATVLLAGSVLLAGAVGTRRFVESVNADVRTDSETEEAAKKDSAAGIDTSIPVVPGSRIAVVSKCVSGEFWDMVHKGMSAAVKDINTAYGFKSDDQIKMTFEGPSDELNVEEQVNTLDAVIAENPAVLCLSASDMDSCQAQIETAMENDIPVIVFDSNVSEDQLVTAFCGTDNERVGQIAGEKMAEALNQQGKILIFSAQGKTESNQKRVDGFKSAVAEYAGMEVAARDLCGSGRGYDCRYAGSPCSVSRCSRSFLYQCRYVKSLSFPGTGGNRVSDYDWGRWNYQTAGGSEERKRIRNCFSGAL